MTKTKLTKAVADELARFVSAGGHIKTAAEMVGLTPTTVYKWFKEGRAESERISHGERPRASRIIHHYLWTKVSHARSSNQLALVMTIQRAASEGNISAAQWLLGNRHKSEFGYMTRTSMDDRALGESEFSEDTGFTQGREEATFGDAVRQVYGELHTSEPQLGGVDPSMLLESPQRSALEATINTGSPSIDVTMEDIGPPSPLAPLEGEEGGHREASPTEGERPAVDVDEDAFAGEQRGGL